jgi:RimJ/RimL family protein N-acetyltransferase
MLIPLIQITDDGIIIGTGAEMPYGQHTQPARDCATMLPMEYCTINSAAGVAALRDLTPEDIEHIVGFWYSADGDFLDFLGIDRTRLGSTDDTRQRFTRAIRTGDTNQPSVAFAITVSGNFAGYTLLNRYAPDVNYSHWHITNPALRGVGLSTAFYPFRIKMYFDVIPINRLIHQTRTRNVAVNRMLDRWVPVAETCYIEKPDGVALPGEFHLRYVLRSDVPRFLEKAAAAGNR